MAKQVRILTFYNELLSELADWAREQDEALAAHGEIVFAALSQEQRELPEESLRALSGALNAFADARPQRRTISSHLEKYLDTILAAADED